MLNFETIGNKDKFPVLFLHGFLGSGADWIKIANSICENYFCILPHLPGHGKSSKIPENDNGFEFTARQIVALLDFIQAEKACLVGYSMGGRVALYTVLKYLSRFSGVVLEAANPGLKSKKQIYDRKCWENDIISFLHRLPFPEFLGHWYNMPIFRTLHHQPLQLEYLMKQRLQNNPNNLVNIFEKLALSQQPNLWKKLKHLEIPTLLISGSLDEKYVKINSRMVQKIPDSRHKIIDGAGHNTHFEKFDVFIQTLLNFLIEKNSSN